MKKIDRIKSNIESLLALRIKERDALDRSNLQKYNDCERTIQDLTHALKWFK
jgi:hypothetical protein